MPSTAIDRLIRSRRKSLCLQVAHDASLIIRAPQNMPIATIEEFIRKKHRWIIKKQATARKKISKATPKRFTNGENFTYLGGNYPLTIVDKNYIPLSFERGFRLSKIFLSSAREVFIRWYKNEARKKIEERLKHYSALTGLKYRAFRISNAKTRWGTCTPEDNLTFSWRLIMAPQDVIDYVVVHEITHTIEKNHSKRFWKKLAEFFPRFKECRTWLKDNEHVLYI